MDPDLSRDVSDKNEDLSYLIAHNINNNRALLKSKKKKKKKKKLNNDNSKKNPAKMKNGNKNWTKLLLKTKPKFYRRRNSNFKK